jgi:hypothetical protein
MRVASDRSRSVLKLMVSAVTAVVLGFCNSAAASTTTTIRTPQGEVAALGKPTAPPISMLNSVVCTSRNHCVAVGISVRGTATAPQSEAAAQSMYGVAATTSDGGGHWASVSLPTRIETPPAISCPSVQSCVAVGGIMVANHVRPSSMPQGATPSPVSRGKVVRTPDGGGTWARSIIPAGVGTLTGVSCPTKTFCLSVGETPDGRRGVALETTSSGRVWTQLSLPRREDRLSLVSCHSVHICVAVVNDLRATVITTTNGGKSWARTSLPQNTTGPTGTDIAESLSCPSATRCFIVGGFTLGDGTASGLAFTSSNGGKMWTSRSLPSGTTGLFGISCRTPTTCAVVGGGYGGVGGLILTTTDAGQTWTSRSEPVAASALESISCPTVDRCVATGTGPSATDRSGLQPAVAISSDGGITWTSSVP